MDQHRIKTTMFVMEQFQAAMEQTVSWLQNSDLSAWEGYQLGLILQKAGVKYNGRLMPDRFGTVQRHPELPPWRHEDLPPGCAAQAGVC